MWCSPQRRAHLFQKFARLPRIEDRGFQHVAHGLKAVPFQNEDLAFAAHRFEIAKAQQLLGFPVLKSQERCYGTIQVMVLWHGSGSVDSQRGTLFSGKYSLTGPMRKETGGR
eukprot:8081813-Pyramimonas_sp.AAC.1